MTEMMLSVEKILREIKAGTLSRSDEIKALAKRAVESMKAREDEDIEQWAERLANDVKDLND